MSRIKIRYKLSWTIKMPSSFFSHIQSQEVLQTKRHYLWYLWTVSPKFEAHWSQLLPICCAYELLECLGMEISQFLYWQWRYNQSWPILRMRAWGNDSLSTISIGRHIITPRACARGKAIGLSVCCHCCYRRQHKNHQISSSRRLCVL